MFKKLVGKVFRFRKTTTQAKVLSAKQRVDSALGMFRTAMNQIEEANAQLSASIEEDKEKIAELAANQAKAEADLIENNTVLTKLSEFLPKY